MNLSDEFYESGQRSRDLVFKQFRDQLVQDINRPEGRWGMHGNHAVDDDYFCALEYVVGELDKLLTKE